MFTSKSPEVPLIIAGPCLGESYSIMDEVASALCSMSKTLNFSYIFKASFDKANRQSIDSYRSPGSDKVFSWFSDIKSRYQCETITDVHESHQVKEIADSVDALQIPAFLCRQTDLVTAAVQTGKFVNIKKGQFMSPHAMVHVINKAKAAAKAIDPHRKANIALTERGTCFGYGDLIVDMRSFANMAPSQVPLIFDVTHSTQRPGNTGDSSSSYTREYAPILARAAAATGKLSGFYIEVHPKPSTAKSDAGAQLSIPQFESLVKQIIPLWKQAKELQSIDASFL